MHKIIEEYQRKTSRSRELFEVASKYQVNAVSHDIRFYEPYPIFIRKAKGSKIYDADGNEYTDFWMGHSSLILGHSHPAIVEGIKNALEEGIMLGLANEYSLELAEIIARNVANAEKIRFCSSGTEATMYAIRLARAYTRKRYILKASGGWHGYNTNLSKNVWPKEILGILDEETKYVKTFKFNDPESFEKSFREVKQDLACVIIEPFMSAGGAIPADRDFLKIIREECDSSSSLLIFDEVVTGFRLGLGGAQEFYKIDADIITLGKIIGGGFPIGAIAAPSEILELADPKKDPHTRIGGGTFSEHVISMKAGILTLRFLEQNSSMVYEKINSLGEIARRSIDRIFSESGLATQTTGLGSLFLTHFLVEKLDVVKSAEDAISCDKRLQHAYYLYLMTYHDVFFLPGHVGSISYAHSDSEIQKIIAATLDFSLSFKKLSKE